MINLSSSQDNTKYSQHSNMDNSDIKDIFDEYCGFILNDTNMSKQNEYAIGTVIISQDSTNILLNSLINNKHAWSFTYKQQYIKMATDKIDDKNGQFRDFVVYLDSGNNNFLKAISKITDSISLPDNPWEGMIEVAQKNPRKFELFLVNEPPAVSLLEALKKVKKKYRPPKEIVAYLLFFKSKKEEKPIWVGADPIWCIVSKDYSIVADSLDPKGYDIHPNVACDYINASTGEKLLTREVRVMPDN